MYSNQSLFPITAGGLAAFVIVAAIVFFPGLAAAEPAAMERAAAPRCTCPASNKTARPKLANLPPPPVIATPLDSSDEIAALQSLQYALNEVPDGASYVWHRSNGRLSGVVRALSSFKDASGAVCRHVLVVLSSARDTNKTEAVACRETGGVWKLDG